MSIRSYQRGYRPKPADLQRARIDKAAPGSSHSPGWPHISQTGNCLCLGSCCMGPSGCRCREGCTHQSHPREVLISSGSL